MFAIGRMGYTWTAGRAICFLLVAFGIAVAIASQRDAAQETAQHASEVAAWKAQAPQFMADIRLGKVDAYGFQQLCGQPSMRVNRKSYFALLYKEHNVVVMFHRRTPGTQKTEAARRYPYAYFDQANFWEIDPSHMLAPEAALEALHCKLPGGGL